jgi:transposase
MAKTYLPVTRNPQNMRDGASDAHLVWFALAVVQRADTSVLHASHRNDGAGRPAFNPEVLLAVLTYAGCRGGQSSRRIEHLCRADPAYRMLCGGQEPDHSTVARFQRQYGELILRMVAEVRQLCAAADLATCGLTGAEQGQLFAIEERSASVR